MATRSAATCAEETARRRVATAVALTVFVAALAAAVAWRGVFLSRDWLFSWVALAVALLALADPRRLRGAIGDWLPLLAVLLLYDLSSPVRDTIGIRPHVFPQLDADMLLPGASIPSVELQHALYLTGRARWYDYAAFAVYLSHFFVTLAVAVAVWRLAHERFRRYRALVVALATAGFVTYVLFPAVPPWMAALDGHVAPVHRIVGEMWGHVGLAPAVALFETRDAFYNEVAAIPSLHAAYPVLLWLFFWGAGRWVRIGLGAYVLAMAFTLVYTGEHYLSDIVVGWLYGAGVFAAVSFARRPYRLRTRRAAPEYEPAPAAAQARAT